MSRSTFSDRLGHRDDDSNHPNKKPKYSATRSETSVIDDDAAADSSNKMSRSIIRKPESNLWVVNRYLGESHSYGSVYIAESTYDGEEDDLPYEMVVKSIEISKSSRLMNEEKFLTFLNNPFVVSCYGREITVEKNEENPFSEKLYYNTLVEYCHGRSLEKLIKRHRGGLAEDNVKSIASDVLVGLKYVHEEKIIHCDINPKNILLAFKNKFVGSDDGYVAKISGFGKAMKKGSVEYGEGKGPSHRRGTTGFMSPELITDMVLDYGADVWAFGCTVLEMLTGERVWGEYGELVWEDWVTLIGESDLVPLIPDSLSETAKDFLTKCLERDPAKRWSVDHLLKHQFLTGNHEEEMEEEEEEEEEEEDEDLYYEIGAAEVEAYEEEEDLYDEIDDPDVEAYVANLEVEEEAIEIDEEYPMEIDSEEDKKSRSPC